MWHPVPHGKKIHISNATNSHSLHHHQPKSLSPLAKESLFTCKPALSPPVKLSRDLEHRCNKSQSCSPLLLPPLSLAIQGSFHPGRYGAQHQHHCSLCLWNPGHLRNWTYHVSADMSPPEKAFPDSPTYTCPPAILPLPFWTISSDNNNYQCDNTSVFYSQPQLENTFHESIFGSLLYAQRWNTTWPILVQPSIWMKNVLNLEWQQ